MPSGLWLEGRFVLSRISPQDEYIVNTQKMKIYQRVFRLPFGKSTANEVRHGVNLVMVHNGRTNAYCAWPFANLHFFKCPVGHLLEHRLAPMIGDIDEGRL